MRHPFTTIAVILCLASPTLLHAQSGEALIHKLGAVVPVPDPTFPAGRSLDYKIAWDIVTAPEAPGKLLAAFERPANFLTMTDAEGVPRSHVHLAMIVFGEATSSLMHNAAYRAGKGVDNESIPLLEALDAAGVQIVVCGQALAHNRITRDQLLPFVKVATSASMARATLAAQGYTTFGQEDGMIAAERRAAPR